ncbi:MAG: hypothetical protein JWM04_1758 [Verrucomicrobiales bacterium]|nr:hypothetical protein [Verrucomicrobiales bacterium]
MAENNPNLPGGDLPPKPLEAAKVQPKKETVRINLPPKPTASPTIKLPTLPAGGPALTAAAPSVPRPVAAAPSAAPAAPRPTAAPAARPASVAVAAAPAAPQPQKKVVVAAAGPSGLDVGLAIFAAVASIAALVGVIIILQQLNAPAV